MQLFEEFRSLARYQRRAALQAAINGTQQDRLSYATTRLALRHSNDVMIYGSAVYDVKKQSNLAVHWFDRLEKLANALKT